ncbi:hypothetical protein EUTSA_v10027528mg [Eutrema salsugineum]|uniref:Cytochrome P450 n=1 Tax=Eutrema salsugineum TaxID=72664 RepID=V4MRY2_EUTSA|nr:hypothetical protein EUTSA_v10027528mg [Eutrema salsugineum]
MDNELNMEIAKTTRSPGIPKNITRLFGDNNLFLQSIESHKHVRKLTFQMLGSDGLILRTMKDINLLSHKHMEEGARNGFLDVKETLSTILIECLAKKVMGDIEPRSAKELALCWRKYPSGWFRFPFKIGHEAVLRKRAAGEEPGEFFKIIFGEKDMMSVENAIQYIYTFFLIANETTPRIIAATIKLISKSDEVMQELQREHAEIVINESLRIITTVPVVLRTPEHDIQVGDYIIPAGWTFMGCPSVHFNPEKYEDPLVFNPWRWKEKDLSALVSKNYIPFGAGPRLCVGAYFAKMLMAIFIHHLCKYRWSMKAEIILTRSYVLMFPHGCDVQISENT